MDKLLQAVLQVATFLIFQTILLQLVAQSRFEKYIRVFSGFLLILLLISAVFSLKGGEDFWRSLESQVEYQIDDADFRMQLRQAEEGREEQIRQEYEKRILLEAEQMLSEERLFLKEGQVRFAEDESILEIRLTVSLTRSYTEGWQTTVQENEAEEIQVETIESVKIAGMAEQETNAAEIMGTTDITETTEEEGKEKEQTALAAKIAAYFGIAKEQVLISWQEG